MDELNKWKAESLMLRGALEELLDTFKNKSDVDYNPGLVPQIEKALTATPKSAELARVVECARELKKAKGDADFWGAYEALSTALSEAGL